MSHARAWSLIGALVVGCAEFPSSSNDYGGSPPATTHAPPDIKFDINPPSPPDQSSRTPTFDRLSTQRDSPPPLSGGTLRVLADGKHAVASDPDRDRIYVVDLEARRIVANVPLAPGDQPGRIAEDADGRVHVVLRNGGAVVSLAARSWQPAARRTVCPAPRGIGYRAKGDQLFVACAGGELVTLPAAGGDRVRTARVARDLRDVVVAGDRLLVTRFRSAELMEVRPEGDVVARARPVDAPNLFRLRGGTAASALFVPSVAWRAVALPKGNGVVMVHQRAFTGQLVSTATSAAPYGALPQAGDPCDGIVQTAVSIVGSDGLPRSVPPAIANAVLPIDVAVSPDGTRIAVVSAGDAHIRGLGSQVIVSDVASLTDSSSGCVTPREPSTSPPPRSRRDAGAPSAHVVDAASAPVDGGVDGGVADATHDGAIDSGTDEESPIAPETIDIAWSETYPPTPVRNRVRAEAVAVAFTANGEVVVQTREPAALIIGARGVTIPLARSSRYDTGHAIFHANTGSQIACAACHPEGGDDGLAWQLTATDKLRTQSLRGGVLETAPLHWAGDMRNLNQIMREVFTGRMAGPLLTSDRVDALGTWLNALPVPARSAPVDDAAVARGRALFADPAVGCATCHAGARLTNNATVDVGTGRPLQVPSLVDVAARAPFMHDGCAPTLLDRFTLACGGQDDRHGVVSRLSSGQIADLVAYLETL